MAATVRQRLSHAGTVGLVAAMIVVAAQYFIALPVGDQPPWLAMLAAILVAPSAYVIVPIRDPIEHWLQMEFGSTTIVEASTPFGPAFRMGTEELLVVALGSILIFGIVAYLAEGVTEMIGEGTSGAAIRPR
jgi:hypothetical protein